MSRGPNIILAGQSAWSQRLASGLSRYARLGVDVAGLDSRRRFLSLASWRSIFRADVLVRVGFRPGADTLGGCVADALMNRPKAQRQLVYWIGSDVQRALQEKSSGGGHRLGRMADRYVHLAGSQPLADDLSTIGIDARVVPFPLEIGDAGLHIPPMPGEFTVLSYVPDDRAAFYGGPQLLAAAEALPDARFVIMGGTGAWTGSVPDNVAFLGWVDEPSNLYAASSCVVRLVEYDSIGGTVVEGLLAGRPVIYSRQHPDTIHVPFESAESVVTELSVLLDMHRHARLYPDSDLAERTRADWDPVLRFGNLARHIMSDGDAG